MQETKINWTDMTWNPASGCDEVSPECAHCYAKTLAERRRGTAAFPVGFDVMVRPWKLNEPLSVVEGKLIFTNSMTDAFHAEIPDKYRDQFFEVMRRASWHRFQVLTKRPDIAARYLATRTLPRNVWLGVTVGVRESLWRVDVLRELDASVRFLSCEPLLEQLDGLDLTGIAWVIGGGESGSHLSEERLLRRRALVRRGERGEGRYVLREDRAPWARHLRDLSAEAGAAFWWKQNGGPKPESGGRLLDGVEHNGMPRHIEGAMPSGRRPDAWRHLKLDIAGSKPRHQLSLLPLNSAAE